MQSLLKNLIRVPPHDENQVKLMVYIVLGVMLVNSITFSISTAIAGDFVFTAIDSVFAVLTLTNLFLVIIRPSYLKTARFVVIAMLWILFYVLAVLGGVSQTGFMWSFTFPVSAFFTLGIFYGGIAVLLFASAIAAAFFIPHEIIPHTLTDYSLGMKFRYVNAFLLVSMVSFLYEFFRTRNHYLLSAKNIELKNVLDELRESQSFRDALYEAIPNPVFFKDAQLRYLGCNRAFENYFGKSESEIIGKPAHVIWPLELATKYNEKEKELLLAHTTQVYEWYIVNSENMVRDALISQSLFKKNDGTVGGIVGSVLDITEIKTAKEAAEAANRTKSQFLANISHEIRTPLNGVIGMADLLISTKLSDEQHEFAKTIKTCADSLLGLLNDVLDLSKIEAGKMHLETVAFDLKEVLDSIEHVMSYQSRLKELRYISLIDSHVPLYLKGDLVRFRQILINIIGNAVKFTFEGEVRVSVSVASQDEEKVRLRMDIRDTGIGIPKEKINDLFQPFSQIDQSEQRRFGGSGLGLLISKKLAEQMQGTIEIEINKDRGTTFIVYVELGIATDSETKAIISEKPEIRANVSSKGVKNVLLVEDNPVNRRVTTLILQKLGLIIDTAEDGQIGLEKMQQSEYDIILMDLHMPRLDGFMTCEAIRAGKAGKNKKTIPVVALTATVLKEELDRCLACGFNGYILKPVHMESLYKGLEKYMGKNDDEHANVPSVTTDIVTDSGTMVFDEESALINTADDRDLLREALILFRETSKGYLDSIVAAALSGNLEKVGIEAHTLKGSAKTIGAIELGMIAEKVEKAAKAKNQDALTMIDGLKYAADTFFNHLDKIGYLA